MISETSFDWGKLDEVLTEHPAVAIPSMRQTDIVSRLQAFRQDLEDLGDLDEVTLSAAYLLWDICEKLELPEESIIQVLGAEVFTRLQAEFTA